MDQTALQVAAQKRAAQPVGIGRARNDMLDHATSFFKDRVHKVVYARFQGRGMDLSRLPFVPGALSMPLRRVGLDPVPELARMRTVDPVAKLGRLLGKDIWLVTGRHEVCAVLADVSSYSNDIRPLVTAGGSSPEHNIGGLGFTDVPDHTRLRKILTPEFTKRRLQRLRSHIDRIVETQLDVIADSGPDVDLVQTFAFPLPFLMICELLGLPDEDRDVFQRIGHARFDLSHGGIGAFGAASESRAFFLAMVRKQRQEPGDGLIGAVIRAHGDDVDDVELSGLADGVFLGGFETTASMLALGAVVLLDDPDSFALVRDEHSIDAVVEELLRYLSVVQLAFPRFARHDLDLFGKKIAAGDAVACSLSGANRDDRLGVKMEDFDPGRRPVSHVAFGHGFHRCVGVELARMEMRAAFPALARRYPGMTLAAGTESLAYRKLSIVYGLDALPVRAW